MNVIGIETSCDETGVAIYSSEKGLLSHTVYSQISLHADYGGVVPELASRDHIRKLVPLIEQTLKQAATKPIDIDGIAYTAGPGLVGPLLIGASVAKSLAWAWNIPSIGIHHMEGHLLAPLLDDHAPEFPLVALLISGGHTLLVQVERIGSYSIMGESLDDAVGEAFDKTAMLLGLGYPGGPKLEQLAEQGNPSTYRFPRPMTDRPGMDFSFSGLKTFARNTLNADKTRKADIARAFQDAIADTLAIKCRRALVETSYKRLIVAGGVSANKTIRNRLQKMAEKEQASVFFPRFEFCADNGAMIALAGCQRLLAQQNENLEIKAAPRWQLSSVPKLSS